MSPLMVYISHWNTCCSFSTELTDLAHDSTFLDEAHAKRSGDSLLTIHIQKQKGSVFSWQTDDPKADEHNIYLYRYSYENQCPIQ